MNLDQPSESSVSPFISPRSEISLLGFEEFFFSLVSGIQDITQIAFRPGYFTTSYNSMHFHRHGSLDSLRGRSNPSNLVSDIGYLTGNVIKPAKQIESFENPL